MKHEMYATVVLSGSLRSKWEFEYSCAALADAAKTQAKDRAERKALWKAKYDEVMTKIKESGLNVREELSAAMSGRSYGRGPSVSVDTQLEADLLECHNRIEVHDKAMQEYEAWHSVMSAQRGRNVLLTHADWMFFFGGLDRGE